MGQRVDGRSDIYALGCVAYWLLTGERVFNSSSSLAMVESHGEEQPLPPSERLGTEVPAALEDLVLRMLATTTRSRPKAGEEQGGAWREAKAVHDAAQCSRRVQHKRTPARRGTPGLV